MQIHSNITTNKDLSITAQVGDTIHTFIAQSKTADDAMKQAEEWVKSEVEFQDTEKSLQKIEYTVNAFNVLADALKDSFPEKGKDWFVFIDEQLMTIVCGFGSHIVSMCDEKFNIDMRLPGFVRNEKRPVCSNMNFETVVEVLKNSPMSRNCAGHYTNMLHFSDKNREILYEKYGITQ